MQRRGMEEDFSWKESGRKYTVLYRALLEGKADKLDEIFNAERAQKTADKATMAAKKAQRAAKERQQMAQRVVEEASNYEFVDINNTSGE